MVYVTGQFHVPATWHMTQRDARLRGRVVIDGPGCIKPLFTLGVFSPVGGLQHSVL